MPLGIVSLVLHNCDVEFAADMKLLGIFAKMNGIRGVLREREILASVRMLVRHADSAPPAVRHSHPSNHGPLCSILNCHVSVKVIVRCTPFESVVKVRHDIPNS